MAATPAFLKRLELDEAADTRAIRRAYARALKQVDQEHDAQGFQYLRDCYEAALAWAASGGGAVLADVEAPGQAPAPPRQDDADAARPAFAPSPVPPPPSVAPVPELAPAALGRLVFDLFCIRFPGLGGQSPGAAEAAWTRALGAVLDDQRLLNFEARLAFELQLAQRLAGGWQQGHEVLFPVAARLLGWDQDRRTLGRLGEAGELLDMALDERMGFLAQDIETRTRQREVLDWLRSRQSFERQRMPIEIPVLEQLVQRFPHWMPLIAPMAVVGEWRRLGLASGQDAAAEAGQGRTPEMRRVLGFLKKVATMAALLMLALIVSFALFADPDTLNSRRTPGESPAAYRERLRNPQPLWQDEPVPQERIAEIATRVRYRPGPNAKAGPQRASFQVFLDEDGKILGANRKQRAADPAFTAAVEKAILATPPFSPRTAKYFMLYYVADLKPGTMRGALVPVEPRNP